MAYDSSTYVEIKGSSQSQPSADAGPVARARLEASPSAAPEIDPLTLTTPRARLEYLRDFLRALPEERFAMGSPGSWDDAEIGYCGSPSCIAGWTRAIYRVGYDERAALEPCTPHEGFNHIGTSRLGLTNDLAERLFWPGGSRLADGRSAYLATPTDAAQVLDHLIRTGEVSWEVARKVEA